MTSLSLSLSPCICIYIYIYIYIHTCIERERERFKFIVYTSYKLITNILDEACRNGLADRAAANVSGVGRRGRSLRRCKCKYTSKHKCKYKCEYKCTYIDMCIYIFSYTYHLHIITYTYAVHMPQGWLPEPRVRRPGHLLGQRPKSSSTGRRQVSRPRPHAS